MPRNTLPVLALTFLVALAAGPPRDSAALRARAEALTEEALALGESELTAAAERLGDALGLWKKLDDPRGVADSRLFLATLADQQGDADLAAEHLRRAVKPLRRLGDRPGLWLVHALRAGAETTAGREAAAVETYRRALGLLDEMDAAAEPLDFETFAVYGRQTYCPNAGGWRSLGAGEQGMTLRILRAMTLRFLADLERASGEVETARGHFQDALRLSWPFGFFDAEIHRALGEIEQDLGRFDAAREHYGHVLRIAHETSDWQVEVMALEALAELDVRIRDVAAARERWDEVLEIARLMAHDEIEARALAALEALAAE